MAWPRRATHWRVWAGQRPVDPFPFTLSQAPPAPTADSAPEGPRREWILPAGGALAVCTVAALTVFTIPESRAVKSVPFLLLLLVLVLAIRRERRRNGLSFFSPLAVVALAYAVMFSVVPLADVAFGHPLTAHPGWWPVSWMAVAGFGLLLLGYQLVLRLAGESTVNSPSGWSPRLAAVLSLGLLGVAVVSVFLWISTFTELSNYLLNFGARNRLFPPPSSSVLLPVSFAASAVALQAASVARGPSGQRVVLFALFWLAPALIVSAFAGQRWRAMAIAVAVLGLYHLGWRKVSRRVIAAILVVLAAVFVGWGQQRNVVGTQSEAPSLVGSNFYYDYVGPSHELGQFRDFLITFEGVPKLLDYQYGSTFLSLIPGAPFPTGGYVYSSAFYGDLYSAGTSVSTPLPGELYMNFGLPGVLAGMLLFGALLGLIEAYRQRRPADYGPLAVYCYSLLPLALVLRGDITTFAGYWFVGLVPLAIAVYLVEGGRGRALVRAGEALGGQGRQAGHRLRARAAALVARGPEA